MANPSGTRIEDLPLATTMAGAFMPAYQSGINVRVPGDLAISTSDIGVSIQPFSPNMASWAESRTVLKGFDTTSVSNAFLAESIGRAGNFIFTAGDFTARIAADTQEGVYIQANDISPAIGAWVRDFSSTGRIVADWFGTVKDGATDDQPAIQCALDVAKLLKNECWLLGGNYGVGASIVMTRGMVLKGTGFGTSAGVEGTTLTSSISNGDPVISMSDRTLVAEGFKIQGNSTGPGIVGGSTCFNHMLTNIHVKDCTVGFDFPDSWTMDWRKCRTDDCPIGFRWSQGTTSTFTSLVAFTSDYGFVMEDMKDCVFTGCEPDEAEISGFDINNCRGITLASPGIEHLADGASGILVRGNNSDVTITSPSFGDHSAVAVNLIDVQATTGSCVTVIGCKVTSAIAPAVGGKIINKAGTATVTLINPQFYGSTIGDVSSCTVVGGNPVNTFQRPVQVLASVTATQHTTAPGTTGNLATTASSADLHTPLAGSFNVCLAINEGGGAQECEYRMNVRGDGTVQTARIVYESAPGAGPQFEWSGSAIRVKNAAATTQNYRYSITRV